MFLICLEIIADMLTFNQWLRDEAQRSAVSLEMLDTTHDAVDVSAAEVATWARDRLMRRGE